MSFFDSIKERISGRLKEISDKKKQDREFEEHLRREQKFMEKQALEKAFMDSARKASRIKAQRDANKLTGLAKLRAVNRAQILKEPRDRPLSKLAEFMQRNRARREANLERTDILRKEAMKMRQEKMSNAQVRKPLSKSGFSKSTKPFSDLKRPFFGY